MEVKVKFDVPTDFFDRFTSSDFAYMEEKISQAVSDSLSVILTSLYIYDNGEK